MCAWQVLAHAAAQLCLKLFALKLLQCGCKTRTESINCSKYFSINRFNKSLRIRTLVLGLIGDLLLWVPLVPVHRYWDWKYDVNLIQSSFGLDDLLWDTTGELGYDGLNGTRKIGPSYAKSDVYI